MIKVRRDDGGYSVQVSPPHSTAVWSSPVPLSPTEVLAELGKRGCHSTDITDALDATGTDWRVLHDAEVLRRRSIAKDEPSG